MYDVVFVPSSLEVLGLPVGPAVCRGRSPATVVRRRDVVAMTVVDLLLASMVMVAVVVAPAAGVATAAAADSVLLGLDVWQTALLTVDLERAKKNLIR